MVPGITDTECRVAQFRYREFLAEADRQRRASAAAPVRAGRVHLVATLQRGIGAAMEPFRHLLQGGRAQEVEGPPAAPGPLAVN